MVLNDALSESFTLSSFRRPSAHNLPLYLVMRISENTFNSLNFIHPIIKHTTWVLMHPSWFKLNLTCLMQVRECVMLMLTFHIKTKDKQATSHNKRSRKYNMRHYKCAKQVIFHQDHHFWVVKTCSSDLIKVSRRLVGVLRNISTWIFFLMHRHIAIYLNHVVYIKLVLIPWSRQRPPVVVSRY